MSVIGFTPEYMKIYCRSCGVEVNTDQEKAEIRYGLKTGYVFIKCTECQEIVRKYGNGHFYDYEILSDEVDYEYSGYKDEGDK
jgi:hypothetical protein